MHPLKKIISGGQTGVDICALQVAKTNGIETGGMMPKGFRTLAGPKPEYAKLYNLQESNTYSYVTRTYDNVKNSDATLRIAHNFLSTGELCTLKAIQKYSKPYFDIQVKDPESIWCFSDKEGPRETADWIIANNIAVLNVAGNSEYTCPGISYWAIWFLVALFEELRRNETNT